MKDMLDRLVNLQNTDERIVAFQKEEAEIPLKIKSLEQEIEALQEQQSSVQAEVDQLEAQLSELDRELEEVKENQRRSQARALAVKTQREYQAVQREGEIARKRRGELDAQIREITEEKDAVTASLTELAARIGEMETSLAENRSQADERLRQIIAEREDLEKTRDVEASLIDPDLMARYQKVFERYKGKGVVRVISGVCNGCYMTVPPQLFNQVLEGISIHQCPNCGRIIYVDEV